MITPEVIHDAVKTFQKNAITDDNDFMLLEQYKIHLEKKLLEHKHFSKQLRLLYNQIDKSKNYQEFTDVLMNCKSLLREIFTQEGQQKRTSRFNKFSPEVDFDKYGINIEEYISKNDKLLALQNAGLL